MESQAGSVAAPATPFIVSQWFFEWVVVFWPGLTPGREVLGQCSDHMGQRDPCWGVQGTAGQRRLSKDLRRGGRAGFLHPITPRLRVTRSLLDASAGHIWVWNSWRKGRPEAHSRMPRMEPHMLTGSLQHPIAWDRPSEWQSDMTKGQRAPLGASPLHHVCIQGSLGPRTQGLQVEQ